MREGSDTPNGGPEEQDYRPKMPQRPSLSALNRKQSLSHLAISKSKSIQSLRLPDMQSQPTTEVSMESIGKFNNNDDGNHLGGDTQSIYSTLNHYEGYSNSNFNNCSNSDVFTIRTNPTLTIYSDGEDGDEESVAGSAYRFSNRLEEIISQPDSDLRLSFLESKDEMLPDDSKQFFILSSAGKPIYSMRGKLSTEDEGGDNFMYGGVIQTIVSSFLLDGLKLKSFVTDSTRFTILNQSPIILLAVSKLNETENELLNQLDLLHSFLLSTLSKPHIIRSFQNKEGFDLRKHLGRADLSGLDLLCQDITSFNAGILVGALQSLRLKKVTRDKIKKVLLGNRSKNLLYGLLVGPDGKLINIMRPRNHTLHTTDLQILFSLVFNQSKNHSEDEELWLPICLPKFNPNGFLYSYVKFIDSTALILMSADKNAFFEMKEISTKITTELRQKGLLENINAALSRGLSTIDIPAPLVHHFIYKSKRHLQYLMPTSTDITNLQKYYLKLHSSVNRGKRFSVSYTRWENEDKHNGVAGLSWVTPNYELYLITGGFTKREVLVSSAKAIVNWFHKYEQRLFVCEGATF